MIDEKKAKESNFLRNNLYVSVAIIVIAVMGFVAFAPGLKTLSSAIITLLAGSVCMGFAGAALAMQGIVSGLHLVFSVKN
jgi:hypothetical protein